MERSHQYVTALLERIPGLELSDPAHYDSFNKIKDSLSAAPDLRGQLKELYKVTNFSDVALALLWIAENVEQDPSKIESTAEEEAFVLGLLKAAFGETPAPAPSGVPETPSEPFAFGGLEAPAAEQSAFGETPQELVPEPQPSNGSAIDAGSTVAPAAGGGVAAGEQEFVSMLEKLVESIQSGSEDRNILIEQLTAQAEEIVGLPDTSDDFKTFCGYMMEFLKYVSANQLFDDIRVMNMMSNVFDPFSQWAKTDPAGRSGILDQPIEMLREFRTLFE